MLTLIDLLSSARVVPVLTPVSYPHAVPLANALLRGGLSMLEVTMRAPDALDALRAITQIPGVTVGAGTVTRPEQVAEVVDSGARFIVSPGLSASLVHECTAAGIPILPGISTATELMLALELGCEVVKFFPAEASGGPKMIAALSAPFPQLRFVPTGGVTELNAPDYFASPGVVAIGGSWMLRPALDGDFEAVTQAARRAKGLAT